MQPLASVDRDDALEPGPTFLKYQLAQVLAPVRQQVIGEDCRRIGGHRLRIDRLAVQALLQVSERGDHAPSSRHGAPDQQFAVDGPLEGEASHQVGKGSGNLVTGPGIQPGHPCLANSLDADTVPFPFGSIVRRIEPVEVNGLVERDRQHDRPEPAGRITTGAIGSTLQPGEQVAVRGLQSVPDLLDLGHVDGGKRSNRLACLFWSDERRGRLGQPRGQTHAKAACDQLEQGPAPLGSQGIQPALDQPLNLAPFGGHQGIDHLAQFRLAVGTAVRVARPDQGHGLGQVTDVVVGPAEQHGVDPRLDGLADHRGLGSGKAEFAGQGGQRPAPVGIGRRTQIVPQQDQFGVARTGQRQPVKEFGKGPHLVGLPLVPDEGSGDPADDAGHDGRADPGPEAVHDKSVQQYRDQTNGGRVHDQQEQAQRQHGDREGQDHEDRPHDRIDDAKQDSGDDQSRRVGKADPVDNLRREPETERRHDGLNDETQHGDPSFIVGAIPM